MTDKQKNKFYIATNDDGYEWFMHADDAVLIPHNTLDSDRLESLENGDTEKLFKHGGEFPGIYISELLEELDSEGLLEPMLRACRLTRLRLDGKKMPDEPEPMRPKMTRILNSNEMYIVDMVVDYFKDDKDWPEDESRERGMPIAPDEILKGKDKLSKKTILGLVQEGWFSMPEEDYIKPTQQAYRNVDAIRELLNQ